MMKTVIVTGASRGIGACVAKEFGKLGYNVVVCYNKSRKQAEQVASEIESLGGKALLVQVDVSNSESVKNMVNQAEKVFGNIDVLVNDAGISVSGLLIDMTNEQIQNLVSTNLISTIVCSREVAKNMINAGQGRIINISSIWGVVGGSNETVYSATKAGIIGFSKALAKELGLMNINVNVVAPGAIETDMMKQYDNQTKQEIVSETALNRLGKPEDVAKVVTFLAGDSASYITGQVIRVDGGWNI